MPLRGVAGRLFPALLSKTGSDYSAGMLWCAKMAVTVFRICRQLHHNHRNPGTKRTRFRPLDLAFSSSQRPDSEQIGDAVPLLDEFSMCCVHFRAAEFVDIQSLHDFIFATRTTHRV
jgi:hypothetical protein